MCLSMRWRLWRIAQLFSRLPAMLHGVLLVFPPLPPSSLSPFLAAPSLRKKTLVSLPPLSLDYVT